jgi:hypothetical protein
MRIAMVSGDDVLQLLQDAQARVDHMMHDVDVSGASERLLIRHADFGAQATVDALAQRGAAIVITEA